MNLNGLTSGITRNVDKIGLLAGVVSPHGINGLVESATNAIGGNIHIPDFMYIAQYYAGTPQLKNGILAAVGGYIIDEFAPSGLKKYGKILSDFGIAYAEGGFIAHLLYGSTHATQGSDPTKPGYNPGWLQNVTQAPTTQQAIAQSYQY